MAIEKIKLRAAVKKFFTEDPGMLKASVRTVRGYQRSIDALLRVTTSQQTAYELKAEHFDLAMADLRRGATPEDNAMRARVGVAPRTGRATSTLNNDITAFRTFVRFLHRREYLSAARNPAIHLKTTVWRPSKTMTDMVVQPSEDVWVRLLEAAGSRHPRDLFVVALGAYTALRESEMLALKVGGIDLAKGEIRVWRTKQQSWHVVPMHHHLKTVATAYLQWMWTALGRLDPEWFAIGARPLQRSKLTAAGFNPNAGKLHWNTPVDPTRPAASVADDVKAAFKGAGFPELYRSGTHTLRRMAAIWITDVTGDRRMAKALLGHATEQTTERYLQWSDDTERLRQAMARLTPPAVTRELVAA